MTTSKMIEQLSSFLESQDEELSELVSVSDLCDIVEHKYIIQDTLSKVMIQICEEVSCGNSTSLQIVELSRVMVWLEDFVLDGQ